MADEDRVKGIQALKGRLGKFRDALSEDRYSSARYLVLDTLREVHFGAFVEGYVKSITEALQRLEHTSVEEDAQGLADQILSELPGELPAKHRQLEFWSRVHRRSRGVCEEVRSPAQTVKVPTRTQEPRILPVLPLRNAVAFPQMAFPLAVGRPKSIGAIEEAVRNDCAIVLCHQRDAKVEDPRPDNLYEVGTLARVTKAVRVSSDALSVIVEPSNRVHILRYLPNDDFLLCEAVELDELDSHAEKALLMDDVREALQGCAELDPELSLEMIAAVLARTDASALSDAVAAYIPLDLSEKQRLLETTDVATRLRELLIHLQRRRQRLEWQMQIQRQVREVLGSRQQERVLREPRHAAQRDAVRLAFSSAERRGFEDGYLLGLGETVETLDKKQASVAIIESLLAIKAGKKQVDE